MVQAMAESATAAFVDHIERWHASLQPMPRAEAFAEPAVTAVFSADMVVGFCRSGALASERVDALTGPVVDVVRSAYGYGVRSFVFAQDTHAGQAPEFDAFPPHCVAGTEESEMIPELRELPFADEFTIVRKNSLQPGLEPEFERWLDAHPGLRTAVVVGNCTDLCTYHLAMHLRLRANAHNIAGFRVIVPADAVDTYDLPPERTPSGAMPHPGDFFHRVFLYHMALNGIIAVASLVEE